MKLHSIPLYIFLDIDGVIMHDAYGTMEHGEFGQNLNVLLRTILATDSTPVWSSSWEQTFREFPNRTASEWFDYMKLDCNIGDVKHEGELRHLFCQVFDKTLNPGYPGKDRLKLLLNHSFRFFQLGENDTNFLFIDDWDMSEDLALFIPKVLVPKSMALCNLRRNPDCLVEAALMITEKYNYQYNKTEIKALEINHV